MIACAPLLLALCAGTEPVRAPLEYAPAPVDNPLKGLVPYEADVRDKFSHSLEFNYLPLSALQTNYDEFDWKPLERMLDGIAARGHQTVFRVYLEYPGKKDALPAFLLKAGLKVHKYRTDDGENETPDYGDKNLRRALESFVAALGKKYDGDPRLGFLTAGLLGMWGEWHNYPKSELFASKAVQTEVLDAYEAAFKVTPVLLRYPAGANDAHKAPTATRKFGYHDDSFAWATLHTGKKGDEWFYLTALKAAGPAAEARWKTQPIGGEIRPEAWGKVFDENLGDKQIQNFRRCVQETHATWLMDSGMFEKKQPAARVKRAEDEVRRMGYEFHAPGVTLGTANGKLGVKLEIENRGVAPFYYDWKPEFALIADKKVVKSFAGTGKLTGLLPGDKPRVWAEEFDATGVPAGTYTVAVRVPNPLPKGNPVRFANATQDRDLPGWLSLGAWARP
jgi:hypothetical protein